MALTDSEFAHPARGAAPRDVPSSAPPLAVPPLAYLPVLHAEAWRNYRTAAFIARAPQAALLLMAAAGLVLAGGWASLRADFAWALLLVVAIAGIVRVHVRGHARSLRRLPLAEAAADLRALLLFCGTVWGAGVFLVLPPAPSPLLAVSFAVLPALALRLILKDEKGIMAFALPPALITALAAPIQFWPGAHVTSMTVVMLCAVLLLARRWPRRTMPARRAA